MKKIQNIAKWTIAAMILQGCIQKSKVQFASAPTDGTRIVCTTEVGIGNEIKLKLSGSSNTIWIDRNNNGTYDKGEKGITGDDYATYTVGAKEFTIYGNISRLDCSDNRLTKLDLEHNTDLTELICSTN